MSELHAIFLGLIQGLTEFLPISSSGHLIVFQHFLGLEDTPLEFDVFLHLGTGLAVITYFKKDWLRLVTNFKIKTYSSRGGFVSEELLNIILGTLPVVILGVLLSDVVENYFREPWIVATSLVTVSIFMYYTEKTYREKRNYFELTKKTSFIIGLSQAIALVPGVSRSGITICTGLALGLDRVSAARFSFMLSTPVIFGAVLYEGVKLYQSGFQSFSYVYVYGFIASFVSGYIAIAFLMRFLQTRTLIPFVYYRIFLALVALCYYI